MRVYDGYPKGIAEDCFGSHKEDKMFVKVQIQSSYKMFVKYNYKVLDDDYVNNLKELFQKKMSEFFVRQL